MERFAYLAVALVLYSHRVVERSFRSRQATDAVLQTLHMSVWQRKPKNRLRIHWDHSQFTSIDWSAFTRAGDLETSMSPRGDCQINAVAAICSISSSLSASGDAPVKRLNRLGKTCSITSMFYNTILKHVRNGCCRPSSSNGSSLCSL
jgi:putative transposase